jgi:hypothetical protein
MGYRLFISHRWRYGAEYQALVRLLDRAAPDFEWTNYSVPAERPYDRCSPRLLRSKIRWVHAVVVLAGMEAHYSEWMQSEIQISVAQYNKPLVWVRPRGISQIPKFAGGVADEVVGWSTRSIVRGIERAVSTRRPDFLVS